MTNNKFVLVFDTTSSNRRFMFEEYDAKCFWQLNYISVTYGKFVLIWLTFDGDQLVSVPIILKYSLIILSSNYYIFALPRIKRT